MSRQKVGSSFRDPSGSVYQDNGKIFRLIKEPYKDDYNYLINSGLYSKLIKLNLLIPHEEIVAKEKGVYKLIRPVQIPFISYPYEWCFSELKDAASITLIVQKIAMEYGMILKDATPYNIQFYQGKPIFIDTLSFKRYNEGTTWSAYRQFCTNFLAPLLLMVYAHKELNKLLRVYINGIPLDLASALLPIRTWLKPAILSHIHIHAKMQSNFGQKKISVKKNFLGKMALEGLIDNLQSIIGSLVLNLKKSEWSEYYSDNNYSQRGFSYKKKIVSVFVGDIKPSSIWDLGANLGIFSHPFARANINTVAFDSDPLAVEKNYLFCKEKKIRNCLPLVMDLANPSPGLGWEGKERMSIFERGSADCVLALALIHHLVITNSIPLEKVASFLQRICKNLIIEFVPKEDPQVQILLQNRTDIFGDYNRENFESVFKKYFLIKKFSQIPDSGRAIYLMQKRRRK